MQIFGCKKCRIEVWFHRKNPNYYFDKKKILCVKWDSCVAGFNMPLTLKNGQKIYPTTTWKKVKDAVEFDEAWVVRNYYLHVKKAE